MYKARIRDEMEKIVLTPDEQVKNVFYDSNSLLNRSGSNRNFGKITRWKHVKRYGMTSWKGTQDSHSSITRHSSWNSDFQIQILIASLMIFACVNFAQHRTALFVAP